MADRVLVWHHEGKIRGDESRIGPTYCLDADYEPVGVRIHAETAPNLEDAEFDIKVDDVSILTNRTPDRSVPVGRVGEITYTTTVLLPRGQNYEESAEDFRKEVLLAKDSWVSCVPTNGGNGKNFTISLELDKVE